MPRGTEIPVTGSVLRWAIRDSGYDVDQVAERLGVSASDVESWTSEETRPRLTQFRRLAAMLKRPSAFFLLPKIPDLPKTVVTFRHPPGAERRSLTPQERQRIREAQRLQRGLSWMLKELGWSAPDIPKADVRRTPEEIAQTIRTRLGIDPSAQVGWRNAYEALQVWRDALERSGVVVLLLSLGARSTRGFSLHDKYAPVIAANTHWNAAARIFTLLHEYGHLITRTDSICLEGTAPKGDRVERWCERFAAAVLLPWDMVQSLLTTRGWSPGHEVSDLDDVSWLANKLSVSLRATALRLIEHKAADWSLYHSIPPTSDEKRPGGGGGGRPRPQVRLDEYGLRTAQVLVRAMQEDIVSRTDVLGFLDVANSDLPTIQAITESWP